MFAGLPCSGISGLVYLLAALCAPFHELGLALSGRSSLHRWRTVVFLAGMAAAILSATGVTLWALGLRLPAGSGPGGQGPSYRIGYFHVSAALLVSMTIMVSGNVLVGMGRLLAWWRRPTPTTEAAVVQLD